MTIIKANGERQEFEPAKLQESLLRVGAPKTFAVTLSRQAGKNERALNSTGRIFDFTQQRLAHADKRAAMRYRLKRAMFDLGPTGYPFEKYIARLLNERGYNAQANVYIRGFCVSHEVDVLAEKGGETYLFECKYHANKHSRSNVKIVLYVKARFEDIARGYREDSHPSRQAPKKKIHGVWLVTNTKCTSEAIKYARCAGLHILSWRYPVNHGLEAMIDETGLYPVTVLLSMNTLIRRRLFQLGLVTVQDLLHFESWTKIPKPEHRFFARLQNEARILLS